MKITLYKNCILTNSYFEVFDCRKVLEGGKTALETYLETLDKISYENDFIYTEESGTFQIELYPLQSETDIYTYNYVKLEEIDEEGKTIFLRYCFIDDIEKITQDTVLIFYSEDIWSSYSASITEIRQSIVSRKLNNPVAPYYLPMRYDGNNAAYFKHYRYDRNSEECSYSFYYCCQLQLYELTQAGEVSQRRSYSAILRCDVGQRPPEGGKVAPNIIEPNYLNNLIAKQGEPKAFNDYYNLFSSPSFQIDRIIALPFDVLKCKINDPDCLFEEIGTVESSTKNEQGVPNWTISFLNWAINETDIQIGRGYRVFDKTFENDFKRISIGFASKQYEVSSNGTDFGVEIDVIPTLFDTKIIMNYQNKRVDITDDLMLDVPFDVLPSEVNTQRRIERQLATANAVFDIVSGTVEVATDIAGAVMTGGISLAGSATITASDTAVRYNYSRDKERLTSMRKTAERSSYSLPTVQGTGRGLVKIGRGIANVVAVNKAMYSSSQGTFSVSGGMLNALIGFGETIISPDNETIVNNLLKIEGYTCTAVGYSLDTLFYHFDRQTYDVIKCETIDLYGSFSQRVRNQIEEIFLNGFRIFYGANINV